MPTARLVRIALSLALLSGTAALVRLPGAADVAQATAPVQDDGLIVATNDTLYTACGRVFPDPQAFWPAPAALPGESPFAKGNLPCRATTFISYDEAIAGLTYLEQRYPDFVELWRLDEDFASVLDLEQGDGFSAGLSTTTGGRTRSPLYLLRITDESVPESLKKYFAVSLSIHGIERAGLEGGLRAAEDLATWAAETPDQRIMETLDDSLPAGDVLKRSSVFFILANPDGWRRGDLTTAGPFFSRYNGNGVDLNRDWPAMGYTYKPYTAWSEPESRSFGTVLKSLRSKWDGGLDLHGQMNADSFSFTLLRSSQRDFAENQRMLQYVTGAWTDASARLSWSRLIKANDAPADDPRMYGVKWGTTWDTIGYTNTGSISNWFDDDLGLGADAISNEMSFSHLTNCGAGNCFIPEIEQLHVDGNKSLIYGLINYTLVPEDDRMRFPGRAGWVDHGQRLVRGPRSQGPSGPPASPEPTPFTLNHTGQGASTFEFDIPTPVGGARAQVTYPNAQGVGGGDTMTLYLDRFAPDDPKAETDPDGWETVQQDNAGGTYAASGAQVDVVTPVPGRYRVRVTGPVPGPVQGSVLLTREFPVDDPGQLPVDASNTDFFTELDEDLADPDALSAVTASGLLGGTADLSSFDSLVAADRAFAAARTPAQQAALGSRLTAWAKAGGNLVLTDDSLRALEWMGVVPGGSVDSALVYAGNVQFRVTREGETVLTYDDPLAAGVAQPGAAEGTNNRHQITDPGPIGYAILGETGGDTSTQPQWIVASDAWEGSGGRTVGTLDGDVTFGELALGAGRVRILGSLVPFPSAEFTTPHGIADYAITYAGYEIVRNLLSWQNPNGTSAPAPGPAPRPVPPAPKPAPTPAPLPATGGEPLLPGTLAGAAFLAVVAARHRRRRHAAA
jgi:hypothetical protein